jgi:hypothetical protein
MLRTASSRRLRIRAGSLAVTVAAALAFGLVGAAPASAACAQPLSWGSHSNGYIPSSAMTALSWAPAHQLYPPGAAKFEQLNSAFRARFGKNIELSGSYRSYSRQVTLKAEKGRLAATPGCSNHGWGRAVDLGDDIRHFGTDQYNWMLANAPTYGWVAPAWARQGATLPEPWHWEFPGSGGESMPDTDPEDPASIAVPRISAVTPAGELVVKEGPIGATWLKVLDGLDLATTVTSPTRIGALTTTGELYVKDGPIGAPWALTAREVTDFDLTAERVVVALRDGTVQLKEGGLGAPWATLASGGATDVELAGDRIGAVVAGAAIVKEGTWDVPWVTVSTGVDELELDGGRIAIRSGGTVSVKEGPLGAAWTTVFSGAPADVELGGDRVAVRTASALLVKEGPLNAQWVTVSTGQITDMAVTQDRVAMISAGSLVLKDGGIGAPWVTLTDQATAVDLS